MIYGLATILHKGLLTKLSGNATDVLLGDGTFGTFASVLAALARFKVGSTTRDMSSASGTQAITGIGFQPKCVIFIMGSTTPSANSSIGIDDGTGALCLYDAQSTSADSNGLDANSSIRYEASGGDQQGSISAFGADGFTITWVKTSAPTGTATIGYLAMR